MFPGKKGLEFMKPLVADMVNDDPKQRPPMDEVVTRFGDITKRLSSWKLRSRVRSRKEGVLGRLIRSMAHWTKQINQIIRQVPPIRT
jgi:hypothetical protein